MARQWQWDDVRIFLAVSRDGTFSGAARALGVDHVTVARRIASCSIDRPMKQIARNVTAEVLTLRGLVTVLFSSILRATVWTLLESRYGSAE